MKCKAWLGCKRGYRKTRGTSTSDALCILCPSGQFQSKDVPRGNETKECERSRVHERAQSDEVTLNSVHQTNETNETIETIETNETNEASASSGGSRGFPGAVVAFVMPVMLFFLDWPQPI